MDIWLLVFLKYFVTFIYDPPHQHLISLADWYANQQVRTESRPKSVPNLTR